jgi:hypothetical protein
LLVIFRVGGSEGILGRRSPFKLKQSAFDLNAGGRGLLCARPQGMALACREAVDRCLPTILQIPISEHMSMTTPRPQAGDILVSERSARADVFTVSVVPGAGDETMTRYSAAIELVKNLARSRQVNGWFTNDQTHYARIASYRS